MKRIFAYGTLKQGFYNYEKYLKKHVISVTPAFVKGELYSLKGVDYPALIDGDEWVHGEIIELADTVDMEAVDELEGYYGEGCLDNEYNRVMMDIYNQDKQVIDSLPGYLFNIKNPQHRSKLGSVIEHGDYLN